MAPSGSAHYKLTAASHSTAPHAKAHPTQLKSMLKMHAGEEARSIPDYWVCRVSKQAAHRRSGGQEACQTISPVGQAASMGRRWNALALMVFVLGASALTAEAATHESFSATSYYQTDDKLNVTSKDPAETTTHLPPENATTTPTTEKTEYTTGNQPDNEPDEYTMDRVEGRYKMGYFPNSEYAGGVQKTTNGVSLVSQTSDEQTNVDQDDLAHRYEHGYYPVPDSQPDEFTFDPVKGRYKNGYHPKSTYAGASQESTTTTDSLVYQDSNQQTDLLHRYEQGYYAQSKYSQQESLYPQQGTSGQFTTMPYPSTGVPFVAGGAGCRTAYWIEHTYMWPSFFTVESTVGDAFGAKAAATFGQTTMLQGLMKYGTDPFDELLSSALTSLLNSYIRGAFGISHMKVIALFNAALVSAEAAKAQAVAFQTENVESISAGTACT